MHRGITVGNKLCAKWEDNRRHDLHRERLRTIRPVVDHAEPYALQMNHLWNNLKREQMLEDRYSEIDRENRILLKKMSNIMKTQTTPRALEPLVPGPNSLNRDSRKKELLRITRDNQQVLKRIQQAQPIYNHVQFEAEHKKNKNFSAICAEFPRPLISRREPLSARSEMVALQADEVNETVPSGPRIGMPHERGQAIEAPREDGTQIVLQDDMQIGEFCYLVEMSTDGRVLQILAHHGDTQTTLELLVKEKTHRKIFRETNGDYKLVAQRLRVSRNSQGPCLLIDEGEVQMPASARGAVSSRAPGASSPLTARSEGGRASKAAEGVRERAAAYKQMQDALPKIPSVPLAWSPQAQSSSVAKTKGRPKPGMGEWDADAMVAARRNVGSAGGNETDTVVSQAGTVYSASCPPGSATSALVCEVDFSLVGDAHVHLRGFTPIRNEIATPS